MIFKIQDGDGAASKLKANMMKDDLRWAASTRYGNVVKTFSSV